MKIINTGLSVHKISNRSNRIVSISNPKDINGELQRLIKTAYSKLDLKTVNAFNKNSLIEELTYFVDLGNLSEDNYLFPFYNVVKQDNLIVEAEQIKLSSQEFIKIEKSQERIGFLLIELEEEYLLLAIPARGTIKNKTYMRLDIGSKANIVDMHYGVPIPTDITAVIRKKDFRLFVLNVLDFERMIGLKQAKLEKAEQCLKDFENGVHTIGQEKWKVTFENMNGIKANLSKRLRNINRLSDYDESQVNYSIQNIERAVNKLQEDKRIKFQNEKIFVTQDSFNTFTAILHDGIVQRVLSGDYDII
ncbi:hypothetical protein [Streptococcus mutans]|uniref:hypothetical protein n=1 Tax=Streptococcus mutans TaxID=1309 RepID=UPI0014555469|nr:hypothetical protein [Streptococcus mutans]MCY7123158.1 hypothetical protein [Streptococcus mutans]NLR05607.1 hypothetical protein [Streptococcus mutans]